MRTLEYIELCDECSTQMVHGICPLCAYEDIQSTREDDPRELNFHQDETDTDLQTDEELE